MYTHPDTHLYIHGIIQSLHQLIQFIMMLCFLDHKHKTLDNKQIDRPSRTVNLLISSNISTYLCNSIVYFKFVHQVYFCSFHCFQVTNTIKKLTFSICWRPYSLQNCSEKFVKNQHCCFFSWAGIKCFLVLTMSKALCQYWKEIFAAWNINGTSDSSAVLKELFMNLSYTECNCRLTSLESSSARL